MSKSADYEEFERRINEGLKYPLTNDEDKDHANVTNAVMNSITNIFRSLDSDTLGDYIPTPVLRFLRTVFASHYAVSNVVHVQQYHALKESAKQTAILEQILIELQLLNNKGTL